MSLIAALLSCAAQSSPTTLQVTLAPRAPTEGAGLRWSPKGASVPLAARDNGLEGTFELGPIGAPPVSVRLERSTGAEHWDVLRIDCDRDGRWSDPERHACAPALTRGKWWSSFTGVVRVPVPAAEQQAATTRPYPLSLWFVEDPAEPEAPPALRWSRRGWHAGEVEVGGRPAHVLITEMHMDGVFDQRDAWALARDPERLLAADSRSLETHVWLDGQAYRAVAIDAHGRSLAFERFDPGITEAEEQARADIYAPDRAAPRAKAPLAFGKDLTAALERAKREKKRVLIDFETTWCGPCATMNQLVYTAQPVVDAARDVIAVKLDGDGQRAAVKQYSVAAYPTIILLAPDGRELRRAVGYQSVAALVKLLEP